MKPIKHKLTIWIAAFFLSLFSSLAIAIEVDGNGNITQLDNVNRYTANGDKYSENVFGVQQEIGIFRKDGTYIPSAAGGASLQISEAALNAISGKVVMALALWTTLNDGGKPVRSNIMRFFPRSAETYSIGGVPYVILTPSAGGGGKPTVTLSAVQANASENGPTSGRFLIALDSATSKDMKVLYSISGKAKNGKDYDKIAKTVLIPAGNVSAYVDINPTDDAAKENTETVSLKLVKAASYKLGNQKTASIAIADND